MSFLIDPPLLVASGAVTERSIEDAASRAAVEAAVVATFIGVSLALYANAPGLRAIWSPFGSRSGREFMLTSGLAEVDERSIGAARHAAALAQFVLYPLWFRLGRAAMRRCQTDA